MVESLSEVEQLGGEQALNCYSFADTTWSQSVLFFKGYTNKVKTKLNANTAEVFNPETDNPSKAHKSVYFEDVLWGTEVRSPQV